MQRVNLSASIDELVIRQLADIIPQPKHTPIQTQESYDSLVLRGRIRPASNSVNKSAESVRERDESFLTLLGVSALMRFQSQSLLEQKYRGTLEDALFQDGNQWIMTTENMHHSQMYCIYCDGKK